MSVDTDSLYLLTKFKLIEMVRDLYQDDREKRKYLNLRTKTDLVEMIQERLEEIQNRGIYNRAVNPPPERPSYFQQHTYTPPPTPTDEKYIQSKYASFLTRKNEEKNVKEVCQKKKTSFRRHASHGVEERSVVNPKPSRLRYDDIENTSAVVRFPE